MMAHFGPYTVLCLRTSPFNAPTNNRVKSGDLDGHIHSPVIFTATRAVCARTRWDVVCEHDISFSARS
jgi:hypothetical protein